VAVKLSPFFSNFANMAKRLDDAGVNGLCCSTGFISRTLTWRHWKSTQHPVEQPMAMRVPLRWIAILYGHIHANLAATSGIHRASDVLKMLMAGADVTMLCSVLIRHGVRQIATIERDLVAWLEEREYESVSQLKGSLSQKNCPRPPNSSARNTCGPFPVTRPTVN